MARAWRGVISGPLHHLSTISNTSDKRGLRNQDVLKRLDNSSIGHSNCVLRGSTPELLDEWQFTWIAPRQRSTEKIMRKTRWRRWATTRSEIWWMEGREGKLKLSTPNFVIGFYGYRMQEGTRYDETTKGWVEVVQISNVRTSCAGNHINLMNWLYGLQLQLRKDELRPYLSLSSYQRL